MLSDLFWRTRFAADPGVVGGTIRLNDQQYTVVGVLPRSFEFLPASPVLPDRVDAWVTVEPQLADRYSRSAKR